MLKRLSDVLKNVQKADEEERGDILAPLNTRVEPIVRIINGSLDEDPSSPNSIVLNGRIDPRTLRFLKVDESYQRPLGDRADIFEALKNGVVVPNIEIGVRGQDFTTEGNDIVIRSPAYIIDGWQRVGTALKLLDLTPEHPVRIFGSVHFGTDDVWERHRFTELNKNVRKVSPNLHLRNMRDGNEAILTLYGLSNNQREFPLYGKISWSQNMKRGELMPATQLAKVSLRLHSHLTSIRSERVEIMAVSLMTAIKKTSLPTFRKNISTLFEVLDECWSFGAIEHRARAPHLKATFLVQVARMFSSHVDFWDTSERVFFVSADMRRKLSKFPLHDPHVSNLAGSGGAAGNILYDLLVNHMNSGRRTGHLRSRYADGNKINPAWRRA